MSKTLLTNDGRVVEQADHRGQDGGNTPMWISRPQYRWDGSEWVDAYLSDGLVGMWDYQQHNISNGTLRDASGNGNGMELTADSQVKGRIGQGIEFDGENGGQARVPHSSELDVAGGDFTISTWVYRKSNFGGGQYNLLEKRAKSASKFAPSYRLGFSQANTFNRSHEDGAFYLWYRGTDGNDYITWVDSPVPMAAGPYYHVLVEYDTSDNSVEIRIDNTVRGSDSYSVGPKSSTGDLWHAVLWDSGSVGTRMTMGVCETRIYNRLLTEREKDRLYRLGAPVEPTLSFEWVSEPFTSSDYTDPMLFYNSSWSPSWRLSISDTANNQNDLYEASDPSTTSWTLLASDITGGTGNNNYMQVNDTYYIYDQGDGSGSGARVWEGTDLTALSNTATLRDEIIDAGVFHENGTTYAFVEEEGVADAPSSQKLALYTASDPTGPFSREKAILDLNDRRTYTGDCHIEKIDGTYYLIADHENNHPRYGTLLMKAPAIDGPWRLVDENVKNSLGGDLEFIVVNGKLHGVSEFSGGDRAGIAYWEGEIAHH